MYKKTTLSNGIRVVTSGMPQSRSVSVSIFLATGSRYENEKEMGVSHFLEHMLFKGTQKRPTSRELSEEVEGVGGILNGETDKELTVYWCKVARPHFPIALDVLTDMVLHSKFEPGEIEKERQVIIEEINRTKDTPAQVVDDLTDAILWPGHPLGQEILGTRETVGAMQKDDLLSYINHQYSPQNAVFAIAGDVDHAEMVESVSRATADWNLNSGPKPFQPSAELPNPRMIVEKRDTEQVHLCLALPGISYYDERRYALDLLNVILGGGMSSRLFLEIRDNLGLAYAIHSYIDHYVDSGAVVVYAGVEQKNMQRAISAILEQLARFKNEMVPATELTKAKEFSKGRIFMRMEDSHAVAGWIGGQEALTGKILSDEDVVSIIDSITAEQIRSVADALFDTRQLRLAVVGPVEKQGLEELLSFK